MMMHSVILTLDGRIEITLQVEDALHLLDVPESVTFCRKMFLGGYDYVMRWKGQQETGRYSKVHAIQETDFRRCLMEALTGKTLQVPAPIADYNEAVRIARALYKSGCDYAEANLGALHKALDEEGDAFQADAVLDKVKKKLKEYSNVMQQNQD